MSCLYQDKYPTEEKKVHSSEKHRQGQAMHGNLEYWFLFHSSLNLASYQQNALRSIYPLIKITSASWRTEKGRTSASCNSRLTANQPDSTQSNDQGMSHLPKSPTLGICPLKPLEQIHSAHSIHTQSLRLSAKVNGNDNDNYTRPCLETQILPEGLGHPELPQRIWWKLLLRQQIPSSHSVNRPSIYAVLVLQNFILQPVLTQHQLHYHFIAVKDF